MILAATDWLNISITLLLILFVIVCLMMTLMILMQRPKQEGLGAAFGGGMTDQMFGARTTNVLQRGTVWFATLFFALALTLAILIGMKNSRAESLVADEEDPGEVVAVVEEDEEPAEEEEATIPSLVDELPPGDEADVEESTDAEPADDPEPSDDPEPAAGDGESSAPEETNEES